MFHLFSKRPNEEGHDTKLPSWQKDLPVGRPLFDPTLRTAAELVAESQVPRTADHSAPQAA